jgi:hypothetical protein
MFPHFKFIQLPFNLIENESLELIKFIKQKGMNCLTTRPFHGIQQNSLIKFSNEESMKDSKKFEELLNEFKEISKETLAMELKYSDYIHNYSSNQLPPPHHLQWSQTIQMNLKNIPNFSLWKSILLNDIHPTLNDSYRLLCELKDKNIVSWFSSYRFVWQFF